MGSSVKWEKLVHNSETISYVKDVGEYRIIIEARLYEDGWEVVKKYVGGGLNFAETYTAQTLAELRSMLKRLRQEKDLSRSEIKDIAKFREKSVKVRVRRGYKERDVEKWFFSIGENFSNYVIVRYGKELCVDIVMEERLKYIEEKLLSQLYETLGLDDAEEPIDQHIYYYTKKASKYLEGDSFDVDFEFVFE